MYTSNFGLYPLNVSDTPPAPNDDNKKMSPDISKCPPGAKLSLVENR